MRDLFDISGGLVLTTTLRWVVIETGSNQALVFRTNKQRLNVAASRLIWSVGFEWIPAAIKEVATETGERIDHIVQASGLAAIICSADAGRSIIQQVTARAVSEAPDLEIWGVVGDTPISDADGSYLDAGLGRALGDAQRELARWRQYRISTLSRDPNLPHLQTCAFTGLPAASRVEEGVAANRTTMPASAGIAHQWRQSGSARDALVQRLLDHHPSGGNSGIERAVARVKGGESDGISHNGWIAILHADGNGIGEIFTNLRRVYDGPELVQRLAAISQSLERCAWTAVADAIATTDAAVRKQDEESGRRSDSGWILPILVGGDDITAVVHGRYAYEFTKALTDAFTAQVNTENAVTSALADIRAWQGADPAAPQRVSLASGLVYTKPHHPFSHGVQLAEELTKSAKGVKQHELSALDLHVLHESAIRSLPQMRDALQVAGTDGSVDLWAGPIVLDEGHPEEFAPRAAAHLDAAVRLIQAPGTDEQGQRVPSGVLHDLRATLTETYGAQPHLGALRKRLTAVAQGRDYRDSLHELLDTHLAVVIAKSPFSRILTAIDLIDVTYGTVDHD